MDMRNCPRCGKLFTYMSSPICSACEKDEERIFNLVKDYINDHPNCTMGEVVQETQVSLKRIMKYIKDGRLEISKGMAGEITCEQCGKPITKGRYCDSCVIKINHVVNEMFTDSAKQGDQQKKGAKMHVTTHTRKQD